MKKINLLIVSIISFLVLGTNVFAANNFEISAPASATVDKSYTVKVLYRGSDRAGSFSMQFSIVNAECKSSSIHSSGTANCQGGVCQIAYSSTDGLAGGTTLATFSCISNTKGTATFKASTIGNDSWDAEGLSKISISSASKSVSVTGTATTAKKTSTTKSTAPKRTTTKKTSSTTKKVTSTTKKTSSTTSKVTSSTSTTRDTNPISTYPTTSSDTTLKIDLTTTSTEETNENIKETNDDPYSTVAIVPDDIKLNNLKIVGYDINFNPNRINYTIDIDKDVKEIYVIAEKSDESIIVDNAGVVDIDGKKEVIIRVSSPNTKDKIDYKIKINIKKDEGGLLKIVLITTIGVIVGIILGIVLKNIIKKKPFVSLKKEKEAPINIGKTVSNDTNINTPNEINSVEPIKTSENIISINDVLHISPLEPTDKKLEDTMEIFDVSPKLSNENTISDEEKMNIDVADEQWLTNNTSQNPNDVSFEVPEMVMPDSVDELFNNIDGYPDDFEMK